MSKRRARCLHPWKDQLTPAAAQARAAQLNAKGRRFASQAYACPAGHWHVGNPHARHRRPS